MSDCDTVAMTNVGSNRVFSTLLVVALAGVAMQMYRTFLVIPQFQLFALRVVTLFLEALPYLVAAGFLSALGRELLPRESIVGFCRRRRITGLPLIVLTGLILPLDELRLPALFRDLRDLGLPVPHLTAAFLAIPLVNPVVIVATVAAFRTYPELVWLRFGAGLLIALAAGAILAAWTPPEARTGSVRSKTPRQSSSLAGGTHLLRRAERTVQSGLTGFLALARFFLVASIAAGLLQTINLPQAVAQLRLAVIPAILVATGTAYLLAAPAAADAFIARSLLSVFPVPALTGFLVVGPVLNLRTAPVLGQFLTSRHLVLIHITVFALGTAAALVAAILLAPPL